MAKRQRQGRGRKETPLAVVGSSSVVNSPQEQPSTEQFEPEHTRYRELLEIFDKTLQRWKANICIPEYSLDIPGLDRDEDVGEKRSDWSYCINYPPTTPPRIIPQGFEEDVTVRVISTTGVQGELNFLALNFENEAFKDPYTNEDLKELSVLLHRYQPAAIIGKSKPSFSLIIAERTKADKERALEYLVGYPNGQLRIQTRKVNYIDEFVSKDNEVLSEPHALRLFNLMDTLIPGTPTATPQPERRANQERKTPMRLPAPGRRRTPPRRP